MKKTKKLLGIITIVVICSSLLAHCKLDDQVDVNDHATITISGTPQIGMKITAITSGNFSGNFEWNCAYYADNNSGLFAINRDSWSNNPELIIPEQSEPGPMSAPLVGKYIFVGRFSNSDGYVVWSAAFGPIQPAD